jgi:hypothetical protein
MHKGMVNILLDRVCVPLCGQALLVGIYGNPLAEGAAVLTADKPWLLIAQAVGLKVQCIR